MFFLSIILLNINPYGYRINKSQTTIDCGAKTLRPNLLKKVIAECRIILKFTSQLSFLFGERVSYII